MEDSMTDARFPERWLNDARLQRVSPSAYRLFGNALMWSNANRTDGHIPGWALGMIPHGAEADAKELAAADGLWAEHQRDGWVIPEYDLTQTSRGELEMLERRRRKDRDRKRRLRSSESSPADSPADNPRDIPDESPRPGQARTHGRAEHATDSHPRVRARSPRDGPHDDRPLCIAPGCQDPARRGCSTCWAHAAEYEPPEEPPF
jgi:hypothetical protein